MNPMDCKQAQNVWSRVMAAQTSALCTNAEKAPEKTARLWGRRFRPPPFVGNVSSF